MKYADNVYSMTINVYAMWTNNVVVLVEELSCASVFEINRMKYYMLPE